VAYRAFFASERWHRLLAAGARPQRLLFASTGTKDPAAPPTLYITGLAAPDTVNTMPEETLLATASTSRPGTSSARAPSPSWGPGPR
jgi:transaldolase